MMDFKGKRWQDLINDIDMETANSMREQELGKLVTRLSSVANKRLRRLDSRGIDLTRNDGEDFISGIKRFSSKNKTQGELKSELGRVIGFLKNDRYSLSGLKDLYKDMVGEMRMYDIDSESAPTLKEFADTSLEGLDVFIYGKSLGYWEYMQFDSKQALDFVQELALSNPDWSKEDLQTSIDDMFNEFKENQRRDYRRMDSATSQYFSI